VNPAGTQALNRTGATDECSNNTATTTPAGLAELRHDPITSEPDASDHSCGDIDATSGLERFDISCSVAAV
jgi:hypothetical protein